MNLHIPIFGVKVYPEKIVALSYKATNFHVGIKLF